MEGFFFHLLSDKPDDKALSKHQVKSPLWNWNNFTQNQKIRCVCVGRGGSIGLHFRINGCVPLSSYSRYTWFARGTNENVDYGVFFLYMTIHKMTCMNTFLFKKATLPFCSGSKSFQGSSCVASVEISQILNVNMTLPETNLKQFQLCVV